MRQLLTLVSFPHIIFSSLAVGLVRYPLLMLMSTIAAFSFCLWKVQSCWDFLRPFCCTILNQQRSLSEEIEGKVWLETRLFTIVSGSRKYMLKQLLFMPNHVVLNKPSTSLCVYIKICVAMNVLKTIYTYVSINYLGVCPFFMGLLVVKFLG